ncbi:peptidoglycan-binding protein [Frigoribacterium sp. PhB24]|uniref:peptidoglycan-binding domain-containing protein n=1 Tax=Frigoribacterium sp. PhB24 TaxID=2485204 RepID=UPI000F9F4A2B|nr:peptidoglycan-binding protein [Frigoribacterium sp. PhB24]ROS52690.1 putative peptidoglycan binding protein [Frigoribacterium sp. PhB24]
MRSVVGLCGGLALVALWAAPVGLLAVSVHGAKAEQNRSVTIAAPDIVTVGSRDATSHQAVTVTARSGPAPEVTTQLEGTITRVAIELGSELSSHEELFALNGRPAFAFMEETPLYRDLSIGDSGPDVLALARHLVSAGVLRDNDVDGIFGPRMRAAVEKYQVQAGFPRDGTFLRSYVVYVPPSFGAVSSVLLRTGQEISAETTVMTGSSPVDDVEIRSASDGSPVRDADQGAVTVVIGSEQVDLNSIAVEEQQASTLISVLETGVSRGAITVTESESDKIVTRQYSGAFIATSRGEPRGSVPATAVYTTATGRSCVVESGSSTTWQEQGMTVHRLDAATADVGELGQSLIDATLIGSSVVRDPSVLPQKVLRQCMS